MANKQYNYNHPYEPLIDETGREVIQSDIGTEKPRTIKNSIRMFKESLEDHYSNGNATY
jgi:hypothetical protein